MTQSRSPATAASLPIYLQKAPVLVTSLPQYLRKSRPLRLILLKLSQDEFSRRQRDNYVFHVAQRNLFKALEGEVQKTCCQLSKSFKEELKLNAAGGWIISDETERSIINLAIRYGIQDWCMLIPFYTSEDGWEEFQRQWRALPEFVVDIPIEVDPKLSTPPVENS